MIPNFSSGPGVSMTTYVGTIFFWPLNYAPEGFALCNGQLLSVSDYPSLFYVLGNRYGGDGSTTFGLPNLQGRVAAGVGQIPGYNMALGQAVGAETVSLEALEVPAHTHELTVRYYSAQAVPASSSNVTLNIEAALPVSNQYGGSGTPGGSNAYPARANDTSSLGVNNYPFGIPDGNTYLPAQVTIPVNLTFPIQSNAIQLDGETGITGTGAAHLNMSPYIVLNYLIACDGVLPERWPKA